MQPNQLPQQPTKETKRLSLGLVATPKGFEGARTEDGLIRQGITQATTEDVLAAVEQMLPALATLPEGTQVGINIVIEKPE
jgi:hypothetical protein